MIEKRHSRLEVHEQIQVAIRPGLSPSDRAEDGDPMSPALPRNTKDLRAATAETLQRQHVSGHVLRVTPRTLVQVDQRCSAQWPRPQLHPALDCDDQGFRAILPRSRPPAYDEHMSETAATVRAEDEPSWAEVVRHAEHGESVAVVAHGNHVADVVPSGELERLRETIEVLSDTELLRDLQEGLADTRAGRAFSAQRIAADLAARRDSGE
jgi:antitoxin (DNA-binding transcriptional repressor) of toxin-antitoxin stability system